MRFTDHNGDPHTLPRGTPVSFRPAVYSFVQHEGKVLMIINGMSGTWELPGGGLEPGENLTRCAIREVKEETGYSVTTEPLPFHIEKDLDYSLSTKKFKHGIHFFFLAKLKSAKRGKQHFAHGENILHVEWIDLKKLKTLDVVFWQKNAVKEFLKR